MSPNACLAITTDSFQCAQKERLASSIKTAGIRQAKPLKSNQSSIHPMQETPSKWETTPITKTIVSAILIEVQTSFLLFIDKIKFSTRILCASLPGIFSKTNQRISRLQANRRVLLLPIVAELLR